VRPLATLTLVPVESGWHTPSTHQLRAATDSLVRKRHLARLLTPRYHNLEVS
jgi:hypothetical protein